MTTRDRAVEAAAKAIDAAHQNPKLDAEVAVCDAIVAVLAAEVREVHRPHVCRGDWLRECARLHGGACGYVDRCDHDGKQWPCPAELMVRGWEG